jgi:DNA-binding CsgD family transcriptional regulator
MSDIYHRLCRNFSLEDKEFVIDYQVSDEQIVRIRASYLAVELNDRLNVAAGVPATNAPDNRPCLLLFLEDRAAILQEELRIEQKKYGLSDRKTEILKLLSQAYSYQDIAQKLQISLNTVKFHVKNINGKKRGSL